MTDTNSQADVESQDQRQQKKVPNKRLCAFLIDLFCVAVIDAILGLVVSEIIWTLNFAYLLMRDALFRGRSIGKHFVELQVLTSNGEACTLSRSIMRNAIFLIPLSMLVEYLVMRFSSQERRLGDLFAKTRVIDLSPERSDGWFLVLSLLLVTLYAIIVGAIYKF